MIYLGKEPVGVEYKIPQAFEKIEHGSFVVTGSLTNYEFQLHEITELPSGIIVYSNDFDMDKPSSELLSLGSFAAAFIRGKNEIPFDTQYGVKYLSYYSTYAVNFGVDNKPSWRSSRTESRGLYFYRPSNNKINIRGFGTGDYDFKRDIEYQWIAWI